jgi:hypothetical protein
MSSHREAPGISKDPVADNTDLYAFVSPDNSGTVTLIANYIPLEGPDGGPNFYEFGDDVLYEINVDNDGDGDKDVSFRFEFTTEVLNPETFLYNTGQITGLNDAHFNRRQFYTVSRVHGDDVQVLGSHLASPPVNIGPRSTPNYGNLANAAIHTLSGGVKVFAGQRIEGFYVDLGSVFDLAALRPFQSLHLIHPPLNADGVDSTKAVNVHSMAIQVPKSWLTHDGSTPTSVTGSNSTIGVWAAAYRRKSHVRGDDIESGPWVQVSRMGNPLFNEVIVPMGKKDRWNAVPPSEDNDFLKYVLHPELAGLLPFLYPGVFPKLAAYTLPRGDLQAILLTGIPSGVVGGFQNFTGPKPADMLRLNMAVPPTTVNPNPLGLVAGDAAGFPNGRRVFDDVATVEVRAIAGLVLPLVDPTHFPSADGAAALVSDFTSAQVAAIVGSARYQSSFPYLGNPKDGFDNPS